MKTKGNIKAAMMMALITSFILGSLTSCDWIINEKHNKNIVFGINDNKIRTNKDEAKLVVKISQSNLNVIELSKSIIENPETKSDLKNLAEELEKTHLEIFKDIKVLAEDKLISIPHYSNIDPEIISSKAHKNIEDESIKYNFELIADKINEQIELLNELSVTTNNKDFKELSKKTNSILKTKLTKTEDTLKKLNTKNVL